MGLTSFNLISIVSLCLYKGERDFLYSVTAFSQVVINRYNYVPIEDLSQVGSEGTKCKEFDSM